MIFLDKFKPACYSCGLVTVHYHNCYTALFVIADQVVQTLIITRQLPVIISLISKDPVLTITQCYQVDF